ncbi:sensor domain-containing diguanylate cyclase [Methylobacterium sp. J-068]|uniref:GGDEF domain-containing protein n=1 Tax=Methylobacterium sp. J-068 TaxID=2836649 RepID=UPI001FB92EFC|nr:GGDEF domain-containing protein [Methylobacterium sp. J-068]MCJ2033650.1 GGDEF domain-containing protein [Methylobacterium sp. J-068]
MRRARSGAEVSDGDLTVSPCLLRFSRPVSARYEVDNGRERALHLRRTILIGLCFHNAYNLTTALLMPAMLPLAVCLRLLLVTPLGLLLAWAVTRMPGPMRERAVTAGMLLVTGVPILLFALDRDAMSAVCYVEYPLMMVFATMMLVLRFPHALVLTVVSGLASLAVIGLRADLASELALCLAFQTVAGSFFVLYGNHQIEGVRRRAYLVSLREILRSAGLERDRRVLTILSQTDALTGLANRRALDAGLEAAAGQTRGTALLMIDVDHFKRFNDTYGHPAGDDGLRRIAEALAGATRSRGEVVARYGGEEFAILLKGGDARTVERVVRRLRAAIAGLAIPHRDRGDGIGFVTVSIGVALKASGRTSTPAELLAEADGALYEAKRRGRNRHVVREIGEAGLPVRERRLGRLAILQRVPARTAA